MILLNDYLTEYIHEWLNETLPSIGYNSKEGVYIYVLNNNNRNNELEPLNVDHNFFIDETVEQSNADALIGIEPSNSNNNTDTVSLSRKLLVEKANVKN